MKSIFKFLTLILVFGIVSSCEKYEKVEFAAIGFTKEEISQIGIDHNAILDKNLRKLTDNLVENQSHIREVTKIFIEDYHDQSVPKGEIYSLLKVGTKGYTLPNYAESYNDFAASDKLQRKLIEMSVNIVHSGNYNTYLDGVRLLEKEAEQKLVGIDLETFFVAASIAKQSAKFWLPTSQGGQGNLDLYSTLLNSNNGVIERDPCWDIIVAADLLGGTSYLGAIGVGLAVPGTNIAAAGLIAWGAGFASAGAFALNHDCGGDDNQEELPEECMGVYPCPLEMEDCPAGGPGICW